MLEPENGRREVVFKMGEIDTFISLGYAAPAIPQIISSQGSACMLRADAQRAMEKYREAQSAALEVHRCEG